MGTNEEATGGIESFAIEVSIADGADSIRVEVEPRGITLTNGSTWREVLTREEAWRLAEAIDAVATRAPAPH